MKHSDSLAKLAPALVACQAELRAIATNATNKDFSSKYVTLDRMIAEIRPTLAKHGLAIVQGATTPHTDEQSMMRSLAVETMLVHSSGEWISNLIILPVEGRLRSGGKRDDPGPQSAGIAVIYGRRYGLAALLSLEVAEAREQRNDSRNDSRNDTRNDRGARAPQQPPRTEQRAAAPSAAAPPAATPARSAEPVPAPRSADATRTSQIERPPKSMATPQQVDRLTFLLSDHRLADVTIKTVEDGLRAGLTEADAERWINRIETHLKNFPADASNGAKAKAGAV